MIAVTGGISSRFILLKRLREDCI